MVPELTTDRLLLVPIVQEDQPFIFQGLSHPDVIPYYGVRYATLEETSAQMDWYKKMEDDDSGLPWKLVERSSGNAMGVISVYFYQAAHNKAEVGFWLLPEFWNRGFASEALHAVIKYWQESRQLHRLEAFVEEGNTASARLLQKAGFKYEGTMVDCEMKNGKYISLMIYAFVGRPLAKS